MKQRIGTKIRQYFADNKIKQKEIAAKLGIDPSSFSRTLRQNTVKVELLQEISELLKIDIRSWFYEDEYENNYNKSVVTESTEEYGSVTNRINIIEKRLDALEKKTEDLK